MSEVEDKKFNKESLLDEEFRMLLLGSSNSGKTTYVRSLFYDLVKKYKYIFLLLPSPNISYKSFVWNENTHIINDLPELEIRLKRIYDFAELVSKRKTNNKTLIILDDLGHIIPKSIMLNKLFASGRHQKLSLIVFAQTYHHINHLTKANITHLVITSFHNLHVKKLMDYIPLSITFKTTLYYSEKYKKEGKNKIIILKYYNPRKDKDNFIYWDTGEEGLREPKPLEILIEQFYGKGVKKMLLNGAVPN